jgi:hypothetical protein
LGLALVWAKKAKVLSYIVSVLEEELDGGESHGIIV